MTRTSLPPTSLFPSSPSPLSPSSPSSTTSEDHNRPSAGAARYRDIRDREQALLLAFERSLEAEGRLALPDRLRSNSSNSADEPGRRYSRADILEAEYDRRQYLTSRNRDLEIVLRKVGACTEMTGIGWEEVRGEVAALLRGERIGGQQLEQYEEVYPLELPAEGVERVDANLLIPGRGEPVRDATLVFQGKTILYAGERAGLPAKWRGVHALEVPVLMPGMWDW